MNDELADLRLFQSINRKMDTGATMTGAEQELFGRTARDILTKHGGRMKQDELKDTLDKYVQVSAALAELIDDGHVQVHPDGTCSLNHWSGDKGAPLPTREVRLGANQKIARAVVDDMLGELEDAVIAEIRARSGLSNSHAWRALRALIARGHVALRAGRVYSPRSQV